MVVCGIGWFRLLLRRLQAGYVISPGCGEQNVTIRRTPAPAAAVSVIRGPDGLGGFYDRAEPKNAE
jgi:hypothetical protein